MVSFVPYKEGLGREAKRMFFVGTVRYKFLATGERLYKPRVRLGDGSHRESRKGFRQAEKAFAYGKRWVEKARKLMLQETAHG